MPPTLKRAHDVLASNLLFLALFIGLLVDFCTKTGLFRFHSKIVSDTALRIIVSITIALLLAHIYYIRQGYRWAKMLFLLFFVLGIVFEIAYFDRILAKQFATRLKGISYVVQYGLQLAATILLLRDLRRSNRPEMQV
jgi:hypothetical protein